MRMCFSEKACYSFLLAVLGTVAPNAALSDEAGSMATTTELYREFDGGESKGNTPGGTLSDAGIFEGPSRVYASSRSDVNVKSGVAGGTLPGASLSAGDAHAFKRDAGGDAKSGVAGGTLPGASLSAGDAQSFKGGAAGGKAKSGVSGGTMPGAWFSAGDAQSFKGGAAGGKAKSGVAGGTLPGASISAGDARSFDASASGGMAKSGVSGGNLPGAALSSAPSAGAAAGPYQPGQSATPSEK
jgi:hypothetical protein